MKEFFKKSTLQYIFLLLFFIVIIITIILYLPYRNQLELQVYLKSQGIEFTTQPYSITKRFQILERIIGEEINSLEVTDVKQVPDASKIPALVYLHIQNASEADIKELSAYNNLSAIEIRNYEGQNLKPFSGIIKLEHLILIADNLKDVRDLQKITTLEHLVIWADKVEDITSVSSLNKLIGFAFYSKSIKDYSPLFKIPKLKYLTLKDVITDEVINEIVQNIPQLLRFDLESLSHPNQNTIYKSRRHAAMHKTTRTVYKVK